MTCVERNHIAALFLALLISVPLLLIVALQGWQLFLKHQWEERLESEAVQTIKVPVARIVWQEAGREFTVDGQFFDVISYRTEGSFVIATGVFDEAETRIATFLNAHANHSPQTLSVVRLLLMIQCFAVFLRWRLEVTTGILVTSFSRFLSNTYADPSSAIVTPPPRGSFYGRS